MARRSPSPSPSASSPSTDGLEPAEEVAQSRRVGVERRAAPGGQRHRGLRPDPVAGLLGGDVAGLLQLAQVGDQVAGRQLEHVLQAREGELVAVRQVRQRDDDAQPRRGVDQRVERVARHRRRCRNW